MKYMLQHHQDNIAALARAIVALDARVEFNEKYASNDPVEIKNDNERLIEAAYDMRKALDKAIKDLGYVKAE
jgi:hypothetical protein